MSPPSPTSSKFRSASSGIPDSVLHTVSFLIALGVVVTLHVLLGEMVPKNIAIAGPESAAMLLIPPYLVYMRLAKPFIAFYNWCANTTLRSFGVEPKDELDVTVSTVELSEMIAESLSEGLLDPEEHGRLTRALQVRTHVVADVAIPLDRHSGGPDRRSRSRVPPWPRSNGRWRTPATPGSPSPTPRVPSSAICTSRTCCSLMNDPDAVVDSSTVRALPRLAASLPVPDALSRLRRDNSHLALVTTDDRVTAVVTLEDLVEDLVGTVRDGTHRV